MTVGGSPPLLFPIARPAALASLIRLPLVPERKPVIVPVRALRRRVSALPLLAVRAADRTAPVGLLLPPCAAG